MEFIQTEKIEAVMNVPDQKTYWEIDRQACKAFLLKRSKLLYAIAMVPVKKHMQQSSKEAMLSQHP